MSHNAPGSYLRFNCKFVFLIATGMLPCSVLVRRRLEAVRLKPRNNQTAYRHTSEEYRFLEKKLFPFFGQRIFEALRPRKRDWKGTSAIDRCLSGFQVSAPDEESVSADISLDALPPHSGVLCPSDGEISMARSTSIQITRRSVGL